MTGAGVLLAAGTPLTLTRRTASVRGAALVVAATTRRAVRRQARVSGKALLVATARSAPLVPPDASLLILDGLTLSSLYQDRPSPGTVPVTADTQPIAVARDLSGNVNHLFAVTDTGRMAYNTTTNQRLRANGSTSVLTGPQLTATAWSLVIVWRLRAVLSVGGAASLIVIKTGPDRWCEAILTNIGGYQQLSFVANMTVGGLPSVGFGGYGSTSFGTASQCAVLTYDGVGGASDPASYTALHNNASTPITTSNALAAAASSAVTSLAARYANAISITGPVDIGRVAFYPSKLTGAALARASAWGMAAL